MFEAYSIRKGFLSHKKIILVFFLDAGKFEAYSIRKGRVGEGGRSKCPLHVSRCRPSTHPPFHAFHLRGTFPTSATED